MKKIILKCDSRDKIFSQRFGSVADSFPKEINFDTNFPDEIQPTGDVKCVAYTTVDLAEDQQNIEFDTTSVNELWRRVPNNPQGSDPRDVLSEAVTNGLLPKGKAERIKKWRSYWRADLTNGSQDKFDAVRSTMMLIQGCVGVGTYWYQEWHSSDILPIGRNPQSGHMYDIQGWKQINGEPHFIIEAWLGRKVYMSREVFNEALKPLGMQTWVLSTAELDMRRTRTLTEWITDLMTNLIIILRDMIKTEQIKQTPTPPVVVPPVKPQPVPEPIKPPKYLWGTKEEARHSVRIICDEMGLSLSDKNDLCATIGAESGWNTKAIGKPNTDGTRDYGIVQVNTKYWIGQGKKFPSTDYVLTHPAECVRWMCYEWKAGNKDWWYGWKNGAYKKFL